MRKTFKKISFILLPLAISGCVSMRGGYEGAARSTPAVFVNASPQRVQDIIMARAASRGSNVRSSRPGSVVLERPLEQMTPEVANACGDSLFGRKVRVVLRMRAKEGGTSLTEERYIVSMTGNACPMPLSRDDISQAMNALTNVKAIAEAYR